MILQIALDTPLRRVFDYRPPAEFAGHGAAAASGRAGARALRPPPADRHPGRDRRRVRRRRRRSSRPRSRFWTSSRSSTRSPSTCCAGRPSTTTTRSAKCLPRHCRSACAPVSRRCRPTEWWSLEPRRDGRNLSAPSARRAPQQRALLAWLAERGRATADDVGEAFKPAQLRALAARGWIARADVAPDAGGDRARVPAR